jgi:hypothetical protein
MNINENIDTKTQAGPPDKDSPQFCYIFAGAVALNVKIHSLLETRLDFVTLDPAPDWITSDCAVVVKIKNRDLGRAQEILSVSNISDIKYYQQHS